MQPTREKPYSSWTSENGIYGPCSCAEAFGPSLDQVGRTERCVQVEQGTEKGDSRAWYQFETEAEAQAFITGWMASRTASKFPLTQGA